MRLYAVVSIVAVVLCRDAEVMIGISVEEIGAGVSSYSQGSMMKALASPCGICVTQGAGRS